MPLVSIRCPVAPPTAAPAAARNASPSGPAGRNSSPGLVQNWPDPSVREPTYAVASAATSPPASAPGSTTTGLIDDISAYTGIGSGRAAAAATRASPAAREPVKPTAAIRGSRTSSWPSSIPLCPSVASTNEKTPAGRSCAATARVTARATSTPVRGWAGWPLTTTGQPAASADAVSPPAVEKASGKLLAPKTATGPSGTIRCRRSGRGRGVRSGSAASSRTPRWSPRRTTPANSRSWPVVRPTSPEIRASGSPLSETAASTIASRSALDLGRDRVEEGTPLLRRGRAVDIEGFGGRGRGGLDRRGPVIGARDDRVGGERHGGHPPASAATGHVSPRAAVARTWLPSSRRAATLRA